MKVKISDANRKRPAQFLPLNIQPHNVRFEASGSYSLDLRVIHFPIKPLEPDTRLRGKQITRLVLHIDAKEGEPFIRLHVHARKIRYIKKNVAEHTDLMYFYPALNASEISDEERAELWTIIEPYAGKLVSPAVARMEDCFKYPRSVEEITRNLTEEQRREAVRVLFDHFNKIA